MSKNIRMLKGLKALVQDAVEQGSRAVEKIQLETARRPFVVLEHIPAIAGPAKVVHMIHDASVGVTHAMIRGITALVGKTLDVALDVAVATEPESTDGLSAPDRRDGA